MDVFSVGAYQLNFVSFMGKKCWRKNFPNFFKALVVVRVGTQLIYSVLPAVTGCMGDEGLVYISLVDQC